MSFDYGIAIHALFYFEFFATRSVCLKCLKSCKHLKEVQFVIYAYDIRKRSSYFSHIFLKSTQVNLLLIAHKGFATSSLCLFHLLFESTYINYC